jgi:cytochrome c oxidase subunit 2
MTCIITRTLFPQGAASELGEKIDLMLYITIGVTGLVFVITQVLLFWFSYKYQERDDRRAYYFPHNTKLELIWTTVPAIFLTVLIVFGLKYWFKITGEAPKNSVLVEVTGHQFGWEFATQGLIRYSAGKIISLPRGQTVLASISTIRPATTIYTCLQQCIYLWGRPVKLVINAQDVIHDVGLPHFRLKMDAVPGYSNHALVYTFVYHSRDENKNRATRISFMNSVVTRCAAPVTSL